MSRTALLTELDERCFSDAEIVVSECFPDDGGEESGEGGEGEGGEGDSEFQKNQCFSTGTVECCDALLTALGDSCDELVLPWIEKCDDSGVSLGEFYFNSCIGS
jgi:hypothetical protein